MNSSVVESIALLSLLFSLHTGLAHAVEIPDELKNVGITEHLGSNVSLDALTFRDEGGQAVRLRQLVRPGRPAILSLVYYECPNLCTLVLNGLVTALKSIPWVPGDQFDIITVSINPKDTPALALKKKSAYLQSLNRPEAAAGWHFLTADEDQVKKLAAEVGFGYRYDEKDKQYAHSAAIFVLTPEGRISRYLYGIQFSPNDLRLSLLEASSGKIGTVIDRLLLFCYRYDPAARKYSVYLTRVMQGAAALTIMILGTYLALFWRKERQLVPGQLERKGV